MSFETRASAAMLKLASIKRGGATTWINSPPTWRSDGTTAEIRLVASALAIAAAIVAAVHRKGLPALSRTIFELNSASGLDRPCCSGRSN